MPDAHQHIFETRESVPHEIIELLRPEVFASIGRPFASELPEFIAAFPNTGRALAQHWPPVSLTCDQVLGETLLAFAVVRPDINLLAWIAPREQTIDGEEFEFEHAMLPQRWRQLYRWFDSFALTAQSVRPRFWRNTPLGYSARVTPAAFCRESGMPLSKASVFKKQLGSARLACWLWTDAGDALFLDADQKEGPVYHVRRNDLEDVGELNDPEGVLDRYLAQVLAGESPAAFDFLEHRKRGVTGR